MSDIEQRLRDRASKLHEYIKSSQIVVDLLKPQMDLFDARKGGHDTYAVRMSVDHQSSIRTQLKEIAELDEAADTIRDLRKKLERKS